MIISLQSAPRTKTSSDEAPMGWGCPNSLNSVDFSSFVADAKTCYRKDFRVVEGRGNLDAGFPGRVIIQRPCKQAELRRNFSSPGQETAPTAFRRRECSIYRQYHLLYIRDPYATIYLIVFYNQNIQLLCILAYIRPRGQCAAVIRADCGLP